VVDSCWCSVYLWLCTYPAVLTWLQYNIIVTVSTVNCQVDCGPSSGYLIIASSSYSSASRYFTLSCYLSISEGRSRIGMLKSFFFIHFWWQEVVFYRLSFCIEYHFSRHALSPWAVPMCTVERHLASSDQSVTDTNSWEHVVWAYMLLAPRQHQYTAKCVVTWCFFCTTFDWHSEHNVSSALKCDLLLPLQSPPWQLHRLPACR